MRLEVRVLNPIPQHVDIAVVGAGPIGCALALALADSGRSLALLEAKEVLDSRDPRAIALSQGSRLILERLGVWSVLAERATPITSIHVSQRGAFGHTRLAAGQAGVPALGYTVEYGDLYRTLAGALPVGRAQVLTGSRVGAVRPAAGCGLLTYTQAGQERALTARLIVQAEGGQSLPATGKGKDYGASAIVCKVRTSRPHAHVAYERFTPEGPIALLPLNDDYALVWTTPANQVATRLAWDDMAFLAALQVAFGERQGRFLAAGPRVAYPLRLATATPAPRPGLVRVGNAAQTLHPVAGQGFNLGLRDVWKLAEVIADTPLEDLGSAAFLTRYRALRRWDVGGGIAMTDLLVELFANEWALLRDARGAALTLLDAIAPAKRLFARKMMFGAQAW